MYSPDNSLDFDPTTRRAQAIGRRQAAELLVEPREALLPGQPFATTILLEGPGRRSDTLLLGIAALLLVAVAAPLYGPIVAQLARRWSTEPGLSYAWAVPLFSAWLLWHRREERPLHWCGSWWGLALVAGAVVLQCVSAWSYQAWLPALGLLATLLGAGVLFGGQSALRWCGPSVALLLFALPLPATLAGAWGPAVQRWSATASAYALVIAGVPAVGAGSDLLLNSGRVLTLEAGAGLAAFAACLAVCTATALLVEAPLWQRVALLPSAIPLALLFNAARLTLAAALGPSGPALAGASAAQRVLVGGAGGWLLIPAAAFAIWLERKFFARVLVPAGRRGPLDLERGGLRV